MCKVNLGYNETICDNLTQYEDEQITVQKYVSELEVCNKVIQVSTPRRNKIIIYRTHLANGGRHLLYVSTKLRTDAGYVVCIRTILFVRTCANITSTSLTTL